MTPVPLWRVPTSVVVLAWRQRRLLAAITRFELQKRYSGSILGLAWVALYPSLLLLLYLFVFLVVFRVRFPGFSSFDYVLYVFSGLVPFIGLSETLTSGCSAMRQSMYLVKNVVLPSELIPLRTVAASLTGQTVSLAILLLLVGLSGRLTLAVLLLPLVLVLQLLLHAGLVFVVTVAGLLIVDLAQIMTLGLMLLMFVSPIAFKANMVPAPLAAALYLNPVFYLIEAYRACLLPGPEQSLVILAAYTPLCLGAFAVGSAFFSRMKGALAEYE